MNRNWKNDLVNYARTDVNAAAQLDLPGQHWASLGLRWYSFGNSTQMVISLENGTLIGMVNSGFVVRSRNYGIDWENLGRFSPNPQRAAVYMGSGRVGLGDGEGKFWYSDDMGEHFVNLGVVTAAGDAVYTLCHLGNGILVGGDRAGHFYRSVNYGETWTDLGVIAPAGSDVMSMVYLGKDIVLACNSWGDGHLYRSIDAGLTWADLGIIDPTPSGLTGMCAMPHGMAMLARDLNFYRSIDWGLTWTGLGPISPVGTESDFTYLGDGLVIIGDRNGRIWRSSDYGEHWEGLDILNAGHYIWKIAYCDGILVCFDDDGNCYRSEPARILV
ncbi:MAG: sialidase family protein [Dehalococcoidia bacterium]